MYHSLADWFHLLTSPGEYEVEAAFYRGALRRSARIPVRTVLELGSGGGNNASHLKRDFVLTLTDISDEMLSVSRRINPECEHIQGDMRTLRLGRTFDAVFAHDAIDYMTTEDDLRASVRTAFEHCRPGGAALFAPDQVTETFAPSTDHGGHDSGGRGLRYLEWTKAPEPGSDTYIVDYAFLLEHPDGSVETIHDRHVCGLFTSGTWLEVIELAGFEAQVIPGIQGETAAEVFVGTRPAE